MPRPAPIPLQRRWAYGPLPSRRLGRSLGVNLLPIERKLCNFDCVYCQYDATPSQPVRRAERRAGGRPGRPGDLPARADVLAAVAAALELGGGCDAITIAGNGEPTLHPEFEQVVAGLRALRDAHAPGASLVLLTNGTRLRAPQVRRALRLLDRPFVKLDAADEETLQAVDRPRAGVRLARLLDDLGVLTAQGTPFWLQAMFMRGAVDNAGPASVARWVDLVARLRPAGVHVTTIDRGTTLPGVLPLPAARLEEIAAAARARGLTAEAFPCGDEARFA